MAHKRFTDKDIWKIKWFRELKPPKKCAWNYLKDNCDNVGVFNVDLEQADFCIGDKIDWEDFIKNSNGNIEILNKNKWWLPDFVDFQYGDLRGEIKDKARLSYIKLLKHHGLWNRYLGACKGLVRGLQAHKDKDKDKDQEKEKEKEKKQPKIKYRDNVTLTQYEYNKLFSIYGHDQVCAMFDKLDNYKGSKGKKYKSDYRAILSWVVEGVGAKEIVKEIKVYCPECKTKVNNAENFCGKCGLDRTGFKEYKKVKIKNKE